MTAMTHDREDERTLVLRLIDGDEDTFCELYARYKNQLVYFALRYLKSQAYAEDIFQDTFAAVWQSRRFIDPDTSFSSYLYTIVRNRVLNQLRSLEQESSLKEAILSQAVDYSNSTSQAIAVAELEAVVNEALGKLTPRQREVFELSRRQRLSHKEIAQALDISVNTVQEYISASLHTIRHYLSHKYSKEVDLLLIFLLSCEFCR